MKKLSVHENLVLRSITEKWEKGIWGHPATRSRALNHLIALGLIVKVGDTYEAVKETPIYGIVRGRLMKGKVA